MLPLIASLVMYYQQKFMRRPQTNMTDEEKAQQKIFQFMPLMFGLFFYNLPAGFLLYFVTNMGLSLVQYSLVKRSHKT